MGILDEAIREHLELKRAHGADDSELKQLEDQAFGPPERPGAADAPADPSAEAPTEFMSQPDLGGEEAAIQDAPPESAEAPPARREPAAGMADIQEPPQEAEEEPAEEEKDEAVAEQAEPAVEEPADEPISEEQPAAEHETIPEPESKPGSHTTEERHAIADQPTQMYDIEEEFAATDAPAPPDEDLVAEEISEARLGPAEPLTPPPDPAAVDDDEDADFFSEQRLSDELDQALEAPIDREPEPVSDEHEAQPAEHTDEHEVVGEPTDEHEAQRPEKRDSDEDVLEETPDFLEESPEDDELWFEQKPPKDFDFDD
jgi:hypothetical protein